MGAGWGGKYDLIFNNGRRHLYRQHPKDPNDPSVCRDTLLSWQSKEEAPVSCWGNLVSPGLWKERLANSQSDATYLAQQQESEGRSPPTKHGPFHLTELSRTNYPQDRLAQNAHLRLNA